jgi:hypothetical protein
MRLRNLVTLRYIQHRLVLRIVTNVGNNIVSNIVTNILHECLNCDSEFV